MMAWQRVRFWLTKPFVLFSLLMILKMYLAGYVIFEGWRLWLPLATGLPSVWVVFCLIELLAPRRKLGLYLTANGVLTSVYFAVIMYYKYFGVIVTYHALQQVNQVTEVKGERLLAAPSVFSAHLYGLRRAAAPAVPEQVVPRLGTRAQGARTAQRAVRHRRAGAGRMHLHRLALPAQHERGRAGGENGNYQL
ncbi:hypothetical protein [Cohnella ginsengisoli]|uniref:hypothetical protein n=1 Tax=Cohnella ginsengisoli TaxID=425004 RepID=UPI0030B8D5EC